MPIPAGYDEPVLTPHAARNVEAAWTFRAHAAGQSIILPDGRCDVIVQFNINDNAPAVPVLTGPATRPYTVNFKKGDTWVGVRLRPSMGSVIWGDQMGNVANKVLIGPAAVTALPDLSALAATKNTDALQHALLALTTAAQVQPPHVLRDSLDVLHASGGRLSITNLSRMVGCTPRHLGRLFARTVGLAPKTYAQLVRFHRAVSLIRAAHLSLTQIALEAGFSDQAHLARDVRLFGGFAPSGLPAQLSQPGFFA